MKALIHILILFLLPSISAANKSCRQTAKSIDYLYQILPEQNSSIRRKLLQVYKINKGRNGKEFAGKIKAEYIPDFDTIRQFPASGRISGKAQMRILFAHGNGAAYSHSDSMRRSMRYFASKGDKLKSKSSLKKIRNHEKFIPADAEAIDLPFHGAGSTNSKLQHKEAVTKYLTEYLEVMKAETPNLPLVVIARSGSPVLFFDIAKKRSDLIDALVFISPAAPLKEAIDTNLKYLLELEKQGGISLNHQGLNWIDKILKQSELTKDSLGKVPTLILTGSKDWEMSQLERKLYQRLSNETENIKYIDIENAQHDLLRNYDQTGYKNSDVVNTLKIIFDFLNSSFENE